MGMSHRQFSYVHRLVHDVRGAARGTPTGWKEHPIRKPLGELERALAARFRSGTSGEQIRWSARGSSNSAGAHHLVRLDLDPI